MSPFALPASAPGLRWRELSEGIYEKADPEDHPYRPAQAEPRHVGGEAGDQIVARRPAEVPAQPLHREWTAGQAAEYKANPRPRVRTWAY